MIATFRTMAICALLAIPAGAFAQDQTGEAEAPASEESGTGDPGLSMGAVEGESEVGRTYVASEHGAWELRCVKSDAGDDPCQLYQLLSDEQDNSVAEISMFTLPEGQQAVAGATIVTPLETLLTANLRLRVDSGKARVYPYSFCSRIGCFARVGFTQGEVDAFKAGSAATVTIVPAAAPDKTVALTLSLSGFTAGWNALLASAAE